LNLKIIKDSKASLVCNARR